MEKKYFWNENDIDERVIALKCLYKTKNISSYEKSIIASSLSKYKEIIGILNIKNNKKVNTCDILNYNFELFLADMSFLSYTLQPNFIEIVDYLSSYEEKKYIPLKYIYSSEQSVVSSMKRMYKHFDISIYEQVMEMERINRQPYLFLPNQFSDYYSCGEFFLDFYYHIPYLYSEKSNNISDIFTFNHECAHALNYLNNMNYNSDKEYILSETPPFVIEYLTSDYLNKKGTKVNQVRIMWINLISHIILKAKALKLQQKISMKLNYKKLSEQEILAHYSNKSTPTVFECATKNPYICNLKYMYSFLIATKLFNEYKTNPEIIKLITSLFTPSSDNEIINVCDTLDVSPNVLIKVFENVAKEYSFKKRS